MEEKFDVVQALAHLVKISKSSEKDITYAIRGVDRAESEILLAPTGKNKPHTGNTMSLHIATERKR